MAKVNLKTVAEEAGFSQSTVSRVLSGQGAQFRIPPKTEKAILDAAARLGYSANRQFFKPEALRARTIGMVIPDLSHFALAQLARTVVERASQSGFTVIACDSLEDGAREAELIDQLAGKEVDGLLILPVGREWDHLRRVSKRRLPMVLMDRLAPDIDCNSVGVDNYQGAYDATEHLIRCGHRRIACIQRLPHAWISEERMRGFREAHRDYGVEIVDSLMMGDRFGQHNGYLETKLLLESSPRPSAIFALSNLVTVEALRALRDHDISVPEDISLVGFDELPNPDLLARPVTVVRQPIAEMARMAVDLLLAQIQRPQASAAKPMQVQLPCELVQRQTVRLLPALEHSPEQPAQ